jgi:hypothetical protein
MSVMSLADPRLIARQYQETRERLVDVRANPRHRLGCKGSRASRVVRP